MQRRHKIISAAHHSNRAHRHRSEQHLIASEKNLKSAFSEMKAAIVIKEIFMGEFDSCEIADSATRQLKELDHRKIHSSHCWKMVIIKRQGGRRVGDFCAELNQLLQTTRPEKAWRHAG